MPAANARHASFSASSRVIYIRDSTLRPPVFRSRVYHSLEPPGLWREVDKAGGLLMLVYATAKTPPRRAGQFPLGREGQLGHNLAHLKPTLLRGCRYQEADERTRKMDEWLKVTTRPALIPFHIQSTRPTRMLRQRVRLDRNRSIGLAAKKSPARGGANRGRVLLLQRGYAAQRSYRSKVSPR
jgi:hypothetical protein